MGDPVVEIEGLAADEGALLILGRKRCMVLLVSRLPRELRLSKWTLLLRPWLVRLALLEPLSLRLSLRGLAPEDGIGDKSLADSWGHRSWLDLVD